MISCACKKNKESTNKLVDPAVGNRAEAGYKDGNQSIIKTRIVCRHSHSRLFPVCPSHCPLACAPFNTLLIPGNKRDYCQLPTLPPGIKIR